MSAAEPTVLEAVVVTPVFVDGLYTVEIDRHGIARLTLYVEQRDAYSGHIERIVAARLLILPGAVLQEVAGRMLAAERPPQLDPSAEQRRGMN